MTTERRNKWLVLVIWSALVGVAGFLAAETYHGVDQTLAAHEARIDALENQDAAQREAQKRIEQMLSRIEVKVDKLQERKR